MLLAHAQLSRIRLVHPSPNYYEHWLLTADSHPFSGELALAEWETPPLGGDTP